MKAYILSVGDELVSGLTVNTNASWLSLELTKMGIATGKQVTVCDQMGPIVGAMREGAGSADVVLVSGGLGPTEDDLTRQALAEAMGEKLVEDAGAMAELAAWFASRGRVMAESNRVQAMRPESGRCLANTCGTAPGLFALVGGTPVYVMPGVPREMKEMFTRSVLPEIKAKGGDRVTLATKISTFGMGESLLGEKIKELMVCGGNPSVGTTVHEGIVSVRIYATGTRAEAEAMTQRVREAVMMRLGALVFGENDATVEEAVAALLKEKGKTVATAESCTGGMTAALLTEVPGSSAYFQRGWVTYANASKTEELGVEAALIERDGAVSEGVAAAMAEGARKKADADFGIGITGIAGPEGGSAEKPVGTVWIGLATKAGATARRHIFPGGRAQVRQRAAQMALATLRWHLMGVRLEDVLRF